MQDIVQSVTAASTLILVGVTIVYAYFTRLIVLENRRLVEQMKIQHSDIIRPYIVSTVKIDESQNVCLLEIRNDGLAAARNLTLSLDKPFYKWGELKEEQLLNSAHAFHNAIPTFPPRSNLQFYLGTGPTIYNNPEHCPAIFTVTTKYSWMEHWFDESTTIDLRSYKSSTWITPPLQRELQKIANGIEIVGKALSAKR